MLLSLKINVMLLKKFLSTLNLFLWALCSSRKYPYPPHGRLMEIPRGRGVSKAKFFE